MAQTDQVDWGVSELSEQTGLSLATVHRILDALHDEGFVDKDLSTRRYRLGYGLMELGLRQLESLEIRTVAQPFMNELARKTMEAVYLTIRDDLEGVSVDRVDSPHLVRIFEPIGVRLPLYRGASRKVILAHISEAEVDRLLEKHPEAEPVLSQLDQIRRQGFAISMNEVTDWAASVAAPVFNHKHECIAGIAVSGPRERLSTDLLSLAIEEVTRTAAQLSERLGHRS